MATLPSYFDAFLRDIRPTENQRNDCKTGHETLRKRLLADEDLKPIIVGTFLQGSYRRATAVRPVGDTRSDVDVITVTTIDKNKVTPRQAMDLFVPFLNKHYKGKWKKKGRSFGIELSYVELDLVITAAPSEAREAYKAAFHDLAKASDSDVLGETTWIPGTSWLVANSAAGGLYMQEARKQGKDMRWKLEPLDIPDREANLWDKTHPLAQIAATWAKSRATNRHFVNVVKAVKWWHVTKNSDMDYPKGYPVEHLLWISCPNGISTVAEGVTLALEDIAQRYEMDVLLKRVPVVPDHGVPEHNVLGRLSAEDFREFHERVGEAAKKARQALDETDICESADLWRELFGDEFPECPNKERKGGYTPRKEVSVIGGGRFA